MNLRPKFNVLRPLSTSGTPPFQKLLELSHNKAQVHYGRIFSIGWRFQSKLVNQSMNSCVPNRKRLLSNTTHSTTHDWKVSTPCKKSTSRWLLQDSSDWSLLVFISFFSKLVVKTIRQSKLLPDCGSSCSLRCCSSSSKLPP